MELFNALKRGIIKKHQFWVTLFCLWVWSLSERQLNEQSFILERNIYRISERFQSIDEHWTTVQNWIQTDLPSLSHFHLEFLVNNFSPNFVFVNAKSKKIKIAWSHQKFPQISCTNYDVTCIFISSILMSFIRNLHFWWHSECLLRKNLN